MLRFYKFYKKDSTKQAKAIDKKYKHQLDSTWKAERKKEKLSNRLARRGIVPPVLPQQYTLQGQLTQWHAIMNDTTLSDSARAVAKNQVKALVLERAQRYPGYQNLRERYQVYGDSVNWNELSAQVPGIDTLKGIFDSNPQQMFDQSEKLAEQSFSKIGGNEVAALGQNMNQLDEWKGMPGQYKDKLDSYTDPDKLKEEGDQKLTEQVQDQLLTNPEIVKDAQAKVSKLLSKYRVFSNSNDLSDAKKHASMDGKTFFERLVIGGNFNVISVKPVSLDLSPELGFRFTAKFFIGVGINYRYTFGDTIQHSWYVSPRNTGFKVYTSYDILNNFYGYGEWNITGVTSQVDDGMQKEWVNNYLLGIGRKFLVHPKLYLTVTALYNLNNQNNNPVYARRFQVRIGFQLSELATRKKKTYYNPNM